jgi:hypothetical protein
MNTGEDGVVEVVETSFKIEAPAGLDRPCAQPRPLGLTLPRIIATASHQMQAIIL